MGRPGDSESIQTGQSLSLLPVFVRSDNDSGEVIGQFRPEQTNPIPAKHRNKMYILVSTCYEF